MRLRNILYNCMVGFRQARGRATRFFPPANPFPNVLKVFSGDSLFGFPHDIDGLGLFIMSLTLIGHFSMNYRTCLAGTSQIQNPDTLRAGRVGAAHGGAAMGVGQGRTERRRVGPTRRHLSLLLSSES